MSETPIKVHIGQDQPGFNHFFGAWVFPGPPTVMIDAGPAATGRRLADGLSAAGIDRVDWLLLSHIHIDHCGGVGAVLERYPEARVVCHASGVKHLAEPEKLWLGSRKVLGTLADVYGPPDPVPPDRLVAHDQADLPGLVVLETPGHAPHHVSYEYGGRLMAGEAAGNLFVINDRQYMRPATPPRFFLTEAADSVRELRARPDQPILYAHYDWAPHSHALLDRFIDQLYRWEGIVETELGRMEDLDDEEAQIDRLIGALYRNDRELDAFEVMTESVQKRELHFMRNSVRGYMGYVAGKEPDKAG